MSAKWLQFCFSGWKRKKYLYFISKQNFSYKLQSVNYFLQLVDLEIRVKENLGGQLEASYLGLKGFTGKKCRRSMYGQGYFVECMGKKGNRRFLSLGRSTVRIFASRSWKEQKYGGWD